ncbi:transaldolase [Thermoleophilia bacterium SCSIO 60948]|nr:transaldolase [Thermoleophilia bacterium SCSIO 60948]
MPESRLHSLSAAGQSVWIDLLSREMIESGELEGMVERDAVVGVTSNPTIFQKAMAEGHSYDEQLRDVAARTDDVKEVFYELAQRDIVAACDLMRRVHDDGGGLDGYVSWEVDPRFAHDTEATGEEAQRLHEWVGRPNLLIKIPATREGLPAVERSIAAGIPVNVTLIFGVERYREVAEAYVRGLEQRAERGEELASVASVASFFISRVDTEGDRRLAELGRDDLRGRLAIANARLAYDAYRELFSGPRWEALAARGATPQRCLWASTSTKDPAYSDVLYVEQLIGPNTVNTMPLETLRAFADHGEVARTLDADPEGARRDVEEIAAAGVDLADVAEHLERDGVAKFEASMDDLLAQLDVKRSALAPA